MATERRKRINLYVGPRETITREDLARFEKTGEYVFEEKKDGFWCLAQIDQGIINVMVSRTGVEFEGAEVAGLLGRALKGGGFGRVVGELTADQNDAGEKCGTRRLHVFDVLDWNGQDLRDLPQTDRREALGMIYDSALSCEVIHLVEQRTSGITAWFDEVINRGGEGIVIKHKLTKCRAKNADGKIETWLRAKPQNSQDMVVISHGVAEKGTPNLDLGMYKKGKLVKVQTCTLPGFLPKHGLEGSVVEVVGWEIFPSGAVRSGHISRLRTDKRPEDCKP